MQKVKEKKKASLNTIQRILIQIQIDILKKPLLYQGCIRYWT